MCDPAEQFPGTNFKGPKKLKHIAKCHGFPHSRHVLQGKMPKDVVGQLVPAPPGQRRPTWLSKIAESLLELGTSFAYCGLLCAEGAHAALWRPHGPADSLPGPALRLCTQAQPWTRCQHCSVDKPEHNNDDLTDSRRARCCIRLDIPGDPWGDASGFHITKARIKLAFELLECQRLEKPIQINSDGLQQTVHVAKTEHAGVPAVA
mmetsp:Transcript_17995/g.49658  ORF Transcript_17995/g.49658 Transcript_17995/m.49658 type:complete len:205 (-) Transcript_17995:220-834(-)